MVIFHSYVNVYQRLDCWMMLFPRRPDEFFRLGWTRRLPAKPVELGLFFLAVKLTGHGHLDQLLGSRKVHRPRAAPLFWAFFLRWDIVWLHRKMVKMVKKGTSSDFLVLCEKYMNISDMKLLWNRCWSSWPTGFLLWYTAVLSLTGVQGMDWAGAMRLAGEGPIHGWLRGSRDMESTWKFPWEKQSRNGYHGDI